MVACLYFAGLSLCPSVCPWSLYLSAYLLVFLLMSVSVRVSLWLSICSSDCLQCLSVCLSACLSVPLSVRLSVCVFVFLADCLIRSDEGRTLETSVQKLLRWPIYIINSVDKTKLSSHTPPPTQHYSFLRNLPPLFSICNYMASRNDWKRLPHETQCVGMIICNIETDEPFCS